MSDSGGIQAAEEPKEADAVVVGNGALGLFLADELVKRSPGSGVVVRTAAS